MARSKALEIVICVLLVGAAMPIVAEADGSGPCQTAGCLRWTAELQTPLDDRALASVVAPDRSAVYVGFNSLDFSSNQNPLPVKRLIRAYDAATGAIKWDQALDSTQVSGRWLEGLAVSETGEQVFAISRDTTSSWSLRALHAANGTHNWTRILSGSAANLQVRVEGPLVHTLSNGPTLRTFRAINGTDVWSRGLPIGSNLGFAATSERLYLFEERFVSGMFEQRLHAYLPANGASSWSVNVGAASSAWRDIRYAVDAIEGVVATADFITGKLTVRNATSAILWERTIPQGTIHRLDVSPLGIALAVDHVVRRYTLDGTLLWETSAPSRAETLGIAPDGRVFGAGETWLSLRRSTTPDLLYTTSKAGGTVDYSAEAALAVNRVGFSTPGLREGARIEVYVAQVPAGPPRDLTATAGPDPGKVTLAWSPPTQLGDGDHLGYRIRFGATTVQVGPGTLTYTDATLAPGEQRTYFVQAFTSIGPGPDATVNGTAWDFPLAPANVTASRGTAAWSIAIEWTPSPERGTPHTGYVVMRANAGSSDYVEVARLGPTGRYVDGDLAPGAYNYRVHTTNVVGVGGPSLAACTAGIAPLPVTLEEPVAQPC